MLKVCRFDIHCEAITAIKLIDTSITLNTCVCVCVLGMLMICYLSKFQTYSMVLLAIIIMLYIKASKLIHLKIESLYSLINISQFPSTPHPWEPLFLSLFL